MFSLKSHSFSGAPFPAASPPGWAFDLPPASLAMGIQPSQPPQQDVFQRKFGEYTIEQCRQEGW